MTAAAAAEYTWNNHLPFNVLVKAASAIEPVIVWFYRIVWYSQPRLCTTHVSRSSRFVDQHMHPSQAGLMTVLHLADLIAKPRC